MFHTIISTVLATASDQPAAKNYSMTPRRMAAMVAALLALSAVIVGWRALARSARRTGTGGQRGAVTTLVLGGIGVIIGGLVVATAKGGLGTGNGLGGGVVAMVVGVIGMTLGGLALARSRRAG